jgi:hypothetical protein
LENATDVIPQIMLSCEYMASSWSARMSKRRHVAASLPVANAYPFGKNWQHRIHFFQTQTRNDTTAICMCVCNGGGKHSPSSHTLEAYVGSTYKQVQMAEFKWQSKARLSQYHRVYFHHQGSHLTS